MKENESIDDIISKCSAPKLIGAGDWSEVTPLYIVAEGEVILKLSNTATAQALVILIAVYYVYNMEYPSPMKNIFLFLEAALMDQLTEARKRVSVNKFLQALN